MKLILFSILVLFLLSPIAIPAWAKNPPSSRSVHIKGAAALVPVTQHVVEAYLEEFPNEIVTLDSGSTRRAIKAVLDGTADVGMASSSNFKELTESNAQKGTELKHQVVGLGAVVPIVHPSNPIRNVTIDQLKKILSGF